MLQLRQRTRLFIVGGFQQVVPVRLEKVVKLRADALARIARVLQESPGDLPLVGRGWDESHWEAMPDRAALDAHLADTFTRSLDLQLLLAGSRMRSRDVAPVIACFSRCSALRDLEEDLAHGLVNVPRDVLAACGIQELPGHVRQLRLQPAFHDWIRQATKQSLIALDDTDTLIKHWPDSNDPGVRVLRIFTRSMRDFFTRRARRLYPEAFETTIAS